MLAKAGEWLLKKGVRQPCSNSLAGVTERTLRECSELEAAKLRFVALVLGVREEPWRVKHLPYKRCPARGALDTDLCSALRAVLTL